MSQAPSIVWFRNDLRLADHPALTAATSKGGPVIAVYIWAPEEEGNWPLGAASRWWLHQSLAQLQAELRAHGLSLILRRGKTAEVLLQLAGETKAEAVFWTRRYEPEVVERDQRVEQALRESGCRVGIFDNSLLTDPWKIHNSSGKPFQVFSAFWRRCLESLAPGAPLPIPRNLGSPAKIPSSLSLDQLELEPRVDWAAGLRAAWNPGEQGARKLLEAFLTKRLTAYPTRRNRPDLEGTSRLSPHLHFGEITARQVWDALRRAAESAGPGRSEDWKHNQFVAELGWREFAHHLLCHFPQTPSRPLRREFEDFPWRNNQALLKAWQRGQTGYPMVDAGMRELWATGWMHNRVRMIVASFLVKDLLIPWQEGARWFWDTLVDADLANNTLGWQWTAGCGADAAPFFRIFNPISQGEKFDPAGDYIRRWVPELSGLKSESIHKPSEGPADLFAPAGTNPGRTYPQPIVDHPAARAKALSAFERLKSL